MVGDLDPFLATMVTRSRVPIESVVGLVRDSYGLEVHAVRLTGERDENFKLSTAEGTEYVLKIANPAEPPTVGDLLVAALQHLEKANPSLPCPRVRSARSGRSAVRFVDASGRERTARLLTYLPGRVLATTRRSPTQRAACGRIGARLARALHTFDHPAAHRALIWDLRHVGQVRQLLDDLPQFRERYAVEELLAQVAPRIAAELPGMRQQVVHSDLNPLNVLVDAVDEAQVTGIIDFGDLTHTALIADVAVTAAELLPEDCASGRSARDAILEVAAAYHACMPLAPEEVALLGTLSAARLLTNLVVPQWHLQQNPADGHYGVPDPRLVQERLKIAAELLRQEFSL